MRSGWSIVALGFGVLLAPGMRAQEAPSELPLTIEMRVLEPSEGRVDLEFTVRNGGDQAVDLLIWDTPFEGLVSEDFRVTRDGEEVPFLGLSAKRGEPVEEDWLSIPGGGSHSATVNLAEVFDFSVEGSYEVAYLPQFYDYTREVSARGEGEAGEGTVELPEERLTVRIGADAGIAAPTIPNAVATRAGAPTYHDCSADEEKTVKAALANGQSIAGKASEELGLNKASSPSTSYTTWFGAATDARYTTAKSHFEKITSTLKDEALRFQCKPDKCSSNSVFAYVYPNDASWNVYLCKAFWKAGTSGADSQGGTLVHEVSHFTKVAGTKDHRYGQTDCQKLAKDDPGKALDNADNHEYFAENP